MQRYTLVEIVRIGGFVDYLERVTETTPIWLDSEHERQETFVRSTIRCLLEDLARFDFRVTLTAAERELVPFQASLGSVDSAEVLGETRAARLSRIMRPLHLTFLAEAAGIHAFCISDKKITIEKLTEKPEQLFPEGVFDSLPEFARIEIREAAMCIAFERNTAAAFHVLRAAEDVLKTYYRAIVKRDRVAPCTWGAMTHDFRRRRKRPSDLILRNLDYVRENFRNPTAHPEKRYDSEEAQSLFNLCNDLISRMMGDPLGKS